jgi:hypothetical protein
LYLVMVVALMVVAPIVSVLIEYVAIGSAADVVGLIGRWFVFWAVGVRLLTAGFSQMLRPGFTSSAILGVEEKNAEKLVVELGFGNTAIGVAGVLSYFNPGWVVPVALVGMVFLGLAGLAHIRNAGKNIKENVATLSDLFVAVVLAGYLIAVFATAGIPGG